MNSELYRAIIRRLQQKPPEDCTVVPGSTPVIAFGHFDTASIATISLNPSFHEFDIIDDQQRFHTLQSLGVHDYSEITEEHTDLILEYCKRYFERDLHFKDYFGSLERFIRTFLPRMSYEDGTLCHLDISQWATKKIWSDLSKRQRVKIISENDIELIFLVVKHGNIETLLLNGRTAAEETLKNFNLNYVEEVLSPSPNLVTCFFAEADQLLGSSLGRTVTFIGWNFAVHQAVLPVNKKLVTEWIKHKLQQDDQEGQGSW